MASRPAAVTREQGARLAGALAALVALVNGIVSFGVPAVVRFGHRPNLMGAVLPFGLHHWGRLLTALFGFLLIYLAFHLWRRRRVAWWAAVIAASVAVVAHLTKGDALPLAFGPGLLLALLILGRRSFTVRSEPWSMAYGVGLAAGMLVLAFAYGIIGFWYLDRRDLGVDFTLAGAARQTLAVFTQFGSAGLDPATRHARWFLDSLDAIAVTSIALAVLSVGLPLRDRYRTQPRDRHDMQTLLDQHGGTSLDFFKLWPDKAFFFGPERRAAIAYRLTAGVAVALGDVVGDPSALDTTVREFTRLCHDNAWLPAFHQVPPQHLDIYRRYGLRALKIGEEASVALDRFATTTMTEKSFRHIRRRFERAGYRIERHDPPLSPAMVEELRAVSDAWLKLPGRRERGFTLGHWDRHYVAGTPVYLVRTQDGAATAFANLVPSYRQGEATVDLMRHRPDVENGTMDFLFTETMSSLRERRFGWFSLGMAPFSGVGERRMRRSKNGPSASCSSV